MAANTYQTKQKQMILACLQENAEQAFTVDEITALINRGETRVGRTTVYRHVEKLMQDGFVRKFSASSGKGATFQYVPYPTDCARHIHLKCTSCGRFIHLDCRAMDAVNAHILEEHRFLVDNSKSLLFGLCEDCMKEVPHGAD